MGLFKHWPFRLRAATPIRRLLRRRITPPLNHNRIAGNARAQTFHVLAQMRPVVRRRSRSAPGRFLRRQIAGIACGSYLCATEHVRRNMARLCIGTTQGRESKLKRVSAVGPIGYIGWGQEALTTGFPPRLIHDLLQGTICETLSHICHTYRPQGIGVTWRAKSRMKKTHLR